MMSHLLLIGGVLVAIICIGWIVYRNLKDEKEFEQELDEKDIRSIHQHKNAHEKFDESDSK